MNKLSRVLLFCAFGTTLVFASCAAEDDINAQTAGSSGTGTASAGSGTAGSGTAGSASAGTSSTTSEKKDDGGCSVSAASTTRHGFEALALALALGLAGRRRRSAA